MDTIASICSGKYFIVPANQRGFSWAPAQVQDLFADLMLAGDQAHYMGPIIVTRDRDEDDFLDDDRATMARYILEDGQQRITSLFLVLRAIQQRFEELGDDDSKSDARDIQRLLFYRHDGQQRRLRNSSEPLDQALSHFVTDSPALPGELSPPIRAMSRVAALIQARFLEMSRDDLLFWKNAVLNQAKFILVDLDTERINRYLAFDAINSRGLPLSEFDKIKNFCILVAQTRELDIAVEESWYDAIATLDSFGVGTRTSEADFIADIYSVYHDSPVALGAVHDAFVDRYRPLLHASNPVLESNFRGFIDSWIPYSRSFGLLTTPDRAPHVGALLTSETNRFLTCLDNMELPGVCRRVLTASHQVLSEADFATAARACEVYTFRVHAVMGRRKDMWAKHLTKLAHEMLRSAKDLPYMLMQLCRWLQKHAPLSAVLQVLSDGTPKYYHDPSLRGWQYCYYFLYEYELDRSPDGVSPLPWARDLSLKKSTQEHILPQSHRDGGWWEAHWPDEASASAFLHRFGNLVLTPNNSALGRKPFPEKLADESAAHCYKHRAATNSEKRIEHFTNGTDWLAENILVREVELLKFALRRWSLPCAFDNDTYALPDEYHVTGTTEIRVDEPDAHPSGVDEVGFEEDEGDAG